MNRDLYHNQDGVISMKYGAKTAAGNGDVIVDLLGYEGAMVFVMSGTITDGTAYVFKITEGDDSGLSDGAEASALHGSNPSFGVDDDDKLKAVGYRGSKRYVRVDLKTVSGSPSTGGIFGAIVVRGFPRHAPVV